MQIAGKLTSRPRSIAKKLDNCDLAKGSPSGSTRDVQPGTSSGQHEPERMVARHHSCGAGTSQRICKGIDWYNGARGVRIENYKAFSKLSSYRVRQLVTGALRP